MSRGLGNIQRLVLEALKAGPADASELACRIHGTPTLAQRVSVHRALRALAHRTIQRRERSEEDVVQLHGRFNAKRYARPEDALELYALTKYSIVAAKRDASRQTPFLTRAITCL